VTPVLADAAEYSQELWNLGLRRYAFLDDGRLVVAKETTDGDRLVVLEAAPREIEVPFASLGTSIATRGSSVFAVAAAFDRATSVVRIDVDTGEVEVMRSPGGPGLDLGWLSIPEPIVFDTPDGPTHALCYPPMHPTHVGLPGSAPPAIVNIHGGPTARLSMGLDPERLFWTSRGFAIIDVDYGGSTGHGRAYRQRLSGEWGIVDVRDCALAAAECAHRGLADASRLVIRGGSAGGFTVLAALAHRNEFAAGAARYAVTDLETLTTDTHKFESRYLDSLVGPYPEFRDRYIERSPINHCETITAPVLLLQGSEDKVVPPSQAHAMRDRLIANGVRVEYIEFPGEGHGFRGAAARIRALEAELAFFGTVLGLDNKAV
jgi:dipeptidyl aminopeptidase/acylaminoacyl peptidase